MEVHMLNTKRYFESFDYSVTEGVRQVLEHFGCCSEILSHLDTIAKERLEEAREEAERLDRRFRREVSSRPGRPRAVAPKDPAALELVVGLCPKCGKQLMGLSMPSCERKDTGRTFYAECSSCPYYYEVFRKGKKYEIIEGG